MERRVLLSAVPNSIVVSTHYCAYARLCWIHTNARRVLHQYYQPTKKKKDLRRPPPPPKESHQGSNTLKKTYGGSDIREETAKVWTWMESLQKGRTQTLRGSSGSISWSYCHSTLTRRTVPRWREKANTKLFRVPCVSRWLSLRKYKRRKFK